MSSGERVQNLKTLALDRERLNNPSGHACSGTSLTRRFGAVATGMGIYELQARNASWPYHFELVEEEWLIVIEGELTLRTPEGETVLRAGDVACFPAGADGAHAVRNHTDAPVRYAMPSTNAPYGDGCVYPDSGKFRIASAGFDHLGRLGEQVDYWDGET